MRLLLLKSGAFFVLVPILLSCNQPQKPGVWADNQINADIKDEVHKLNDQVFKDLKIDDNKHLRFSLSKDLLDNKYIISEFSYVHNALNHNDYLPFKEYYVVNKWRSRDTITSSNQGINNYSLYYPGTEKEMYIAMFLPKNGNNKMMLTATYCKFDYGWKLAKLNLGYYTTNGMTSPELFNVAQDKFKKNYLFDAVTTMTLATGMEPNDYWQYPRDSLMITFYHKIIDMANQKFKFPLPISQVSGSPHIFRISNQKMSYGTYPCIYYVTNIKLKDTVAIKKENANIRKAIGQVIPGIDKEKDYLFYSAFNEMPHVNKYVDHFDMTDKLH